MDNKELLKAALIDTRKFYEEAIATPRIFRVDPTHESMDEDEVKEHYIVFGGVCTIAKHMLRKHMTLNIMDTLELDESVLAKEFEYMYWNYSKRVLGIAFTPMYLCPRPVHIRQRSNWVWDDIVTECFEPRIKLIDYMLQVLDQREDNNSDT